MQSVSFIGSDVGFRCNFRGSDCVMPRPGGMVARRQRRRGVRIPEYRGGRPGVQHPGNDPCSHDRQRPAARAGGTEQDGNMENWKTLEADGCVWHVRSVTNPDLGTEPGQSVLEFQAEGSTLPPRRVVMADAVLQEMDEAELRSAYLRALPIGGDHYGRPGKRMTDAG
jgi:hypothetical protein